MSQSFSVAAGFEALNDLSPYSLPWPSPPSSLELQQMVEVCSRPPAIGECVCRCMVLRCPPWWCMVSGPHVGYSCSRLLLDVITDLVACLQFINSPVSSSSQIWWKRKSKSWTRLDVALCVFVCTRTVHSVTSDQKLPQESKTAFEEYSDRADWTGCTLLSVVESDAVCVSILSLHPLLFKDTKWKWHCLSGDCCFHFIFYHFLIFFFSGCLQRVKSFG